MLLTRRTAIYKLRAATNMRWEWCQDSVKKLAVVPDGKRLKLHARDLQKLIDETLNPKPVTVQGVRPLSEKKIARMRARGCFEVNRT